ncbi:MAG: hypothetical protein KatS3mg126_1796 [Lysobacteraceae bacterium]|nr:MAG: hypothetical protein KatS3mg126_1796 [Xanthomonadaceae bacterium]
MKPPTLSTLLLAVLLTGCASAPGLPETTYFRLPPVQAPAPAAAPLDAPLVVEVFEADGLYGESALLYALDADGARLRAYHYQRWVDPPPRMLQRRLIEALQAAGAAPLVTGRLPPHERQYRLRVRIDALERLPRGEERWAVRVGLHARLDDSDGSRPLLERAYRHERDSAGPRVRDTVAAMGAAIDAIFAELASDLAKTQGG